MVSLSAIPNALLFAATGLVFFALVAGLLFRSSFRDLWIRGTSGGEVSAALVVAALLLSIAFIIGSAVH